MNPELAEQIAPMAAPLYAAMLARVIAVRTDSEIPAAILAALRRDAITQAHALWMDILDTCMRGRA